MTPKRGPTLRAQWLGQQLRELRETAGFKLADAGDYIQRDQSTISRMESGTMPPRVPDMQSLLTFYDVDDEEVRHSLEQQSRDVWRKGWWDGYAGHVTGTLMDFTWLEERACAIRSFAPLVIPGLLQTREYAEATIRAADPKASIDQVEHWVDFRMTRQRVLAKDDPPRVSAVVDEAELRRKVGGREVLAEQLARLQEYAGKPNIDVRVLPFDAGALASPDGAFSIFAMDEPFPEVAYVETPAGAIYVETPHTERFLVMYDRLREASLGVDESARLISTAMEEVQ